MVSSRCLPPNPFHHQYLYFLAVLYHQTSFFNMPHPQGCDHATHAGPISDAEDDPPHPTEPPLVATAPESTTIHFQHMVILTKSMNSLKRHVNSEKQTCCN